VARDSSIQILDKYLATCASLTISEDEFHVKKAAVVSMLLGYKLQQTRYEEWEMLEELEALHRTLDLESFEIHLLEAINYDFDPTSAPALLIDKLLHSWCIAFPSQLRECIFQSATSLVGEFWELDDSRFFQPPIIAVTAVLITLSKFNIECPLPLEYCVYADEINDCVTSFGGLVKVPEDKMDCTLPATFDTITLNSKDAEDHEEIDIARSTSMSPTDVHSFHSALESQYIEYC